MDIIPDRNHPYRQELYQILEEREWLDKNIDEIMSKYAARWIGIKNKAVVAVADDPDALKQELATQGINCRMLFFVPTSVHKQI
ncbi:MAG: hypothetical protein HYY30_06970 [Chloroflexi bacterium]|nr:hypothetical protein [Chloroflexota bacterium]